MSLRETQRGKEGTGKQKETKDDRDCGHEAGRGREKRGDGDSNVERRGERHTNANGRIEM